MDYVILHYIVEAVARQRENIIYISLSSLFEVINK